ncbi:ABC transporter permease [Candidatus Epulonipiscium fishelsonii]|uniref:ABC transporter permease n=1 Tax=Candidatus Epulonipiscium fishelsonii TaxID=77094 RepID=A0ACC8XEJ9_9FIRM|nr:ABC transporter permease [Epulopiscium sp. SCG-B11WGA-EpuloA1]ONI43236.1 ABC transporter permease [Epulopiscium sp. SCG-B05WGA-EpuloA1]
MYDLKNKKDKMIAFLTFAFIPLFALTTVILIPFILGVLTTLTDWNGLEVTKFVGLENYMTALSDPDFTSTFFNTIKYVVVSMITVNVVGFSLALLVTSNIKGKNIYRSIFFVPNLIGGVLLGFIWQFIFSRVLVYFGKATGIAIFAESWLVDPTKAFWAIVIVTVWQQAGYMMLIYIAGIVSVPTDVIEAANVDGATPTQILFKIRIPLMIQSFTISLFMTLKSAFMMYDVNLSLTGGGPYRSTELLTMNIYNDAFLYQEYAPAQAKAVILFIIVAVVAISQVAITKKMEVE